MRRRRCLLKVEFDLHGEGADSYQALERGLAELGLGRTIPRGGRQVQLPNNTFAAILRDSRPAGLLRDTLLEDVGRLMRRLDVSADYFVSAARGWAYGRRST